MKNNRPMFIIRNGGKTNLKGNKTSSSTLVDIDNFDELNAEDNISGYSKIADIKEKLSPQKPTTHNSRKFWKWFLGAFTALAVTVLGGYIEHFFDK
ncbi:hypothetical protein [Escherichia coli]|uniref:hypothetical protein n=1 Tax=Escherichia coli TaxID=562 RepID=UPI0012FFB62D|nr:hypothetical protein [Escherichia coli]EHI1080818.1 hypothetical protein [Escherichia coli]EIZ4146075.1 hypothetical protein [Escherichia coli]